MSNLLAMTVAGSVIVGLMLLLRPVTARIFPARWQIELGKWQLFFSSYLFHFCGKTPFCLASHNYPVSILLESCQDYPGRSAVKWFGGDAMDSLLGRHFPMTIEKNLPVEVMQMILFIWFWVQSFLPHGISTVITDLSSDFERTAFPYQRIPQPPALLSSYKAALGIHGEVKLMQNPKLQALCLQGYTPMILLPTLNMQGMT
jgi:hypothetical protein